jgi:hypothetical protein
MTPSWFLSFQAIRFCVSQLWNQGAGGIVLLVHGLDEVEPGKSPHGRRGGIEQGDEDERPARDLRASLALGTVKKRTITWGRPAVPIISAAG